MSRLYLRHHDVASRVLMYDTVGGRNLTVPSDRVPEGRKPNRGFFVDVVGRVYGVYASASGPVFFDGGKRIALHQGKVQVSRHALDDGMMLFRLEALGEDPVEVRYRPVAPTYTHALDDEEMSDFFTWLEKGLSRERFYTWHTVP